MICLYLVITVVFTMMSRAEADLSKIVQQSVNDNFWTSVGIGVAVLGMASLAIKYFIWRNYTLKGIIEGSFFGRERSLEKYIAKQSNENLVKLLRHSNSKVQAESLRTLIARKDRSLIKSLIDLLRDGITYIDGYVDENIGLVSIVKVLKQLKVSDEEMFQTYLDIVKSGTISGKRFAVKALGEISDKRALEPLLSLLDNRDLLCEAIKSLGRLSDSRALKPILARIHNLDFGRFPESEIINVLEKLKANKEDMFFVYTKFFKWCEKYEKVDDYALYRKVEPAYALAEMGDRQGVEALLAMLSNSFDLVRGEAADALKRLSVSQEDLFCGYVAALKSKQGEPRSAIREAAEALGNLGDKRAIEPIFEALATKHFPPEWELLDALKKLGAPAERIIQAYLKEIQDFSPYGPFFPREKYAEAMLLTEGYEHMDVLKRLIERQPNSIKSPLFRFMKEAVRYKLEGYDFKVHYEEEISHYEPDPSGYYSPPGALTLDREEILNIERGDKLTDKTI